MDNIKKLNPKKLLDKGEKIMYEGFYNIVERTIENNFSTMLFQIDVNPDGNNIQTVQWYYLGEKSISEDNLLYETYILSSFGKNGKQIGSITFNGFYPDKGSDGITKTLIYKFTVLGTSGIYQRITSVIVDFTDHIRKLYFVTKKL